MKNWEYKFTNALRPENIKEYGLQGWELIQIITHANVKNDKDETVTVHEGVFKREIAS